MQWIRREYAVRGEQIVPVPGSSIEEYFPEESPSFYLDLVNLYPLQSPAAVERGVRRWGLLGLYQHQVRQLRFKGAVGGDLLAHPSALFDVGSALKPETRHEGEVFALNREDMTEDWFREVPFGPVFARYFPGLKWPDDLWAEGVNLWDHLNEPLDGFCEEVERLHKTFNLCTSWCAGERDESVTRSLNYRFRSGMGGIRSRVEFTEESEGPVLIPELPSLLAGAYHQMMLDLQAGRYLRFCRNERCGKALVTERLNTYFCSARCMEAARKREYRSRMGR